jgi:Phage XkdN-like protein.
MNALDLLLKAEIPELPEKDLKIKRLSELCKEDVVFKIKALPYSQATEISKAQKDDMNVHIVLAGTVEPNLKDGELLAKYNAATPAELVKKMLLPGEVEDISRSIETLSGYRTVTIEEIKKK